MSTTAQRPRVNQPRGYDRPGAPEPQLIRGVKHEYLYFPEDWHDEATGTHYKKGYYDEQGTHYDVVCFSRGGRYENVICRCGYCGHSSVLSLENTRDVITNLKCPQCLAPLTIETQLDEYAGQPAQGQPSGKTGSGNVGTKRFVLLLVLLLAAAALLVFGAGRRSPAETATEAPPADIGSLSKYLSTDADGAQSYIVTTQNFPEFYDAVISNSDPVTGNGADGVNVRLRLTFKLKPGLEERIDPEASKVNIKVEGSFVLTEIKTVDWFTGEVKLTNNSSAERVSGIQGILLANGQPELAAQFERLFSETDEGALEIPTQLNRLADGVFLLRSGVKGPVSPITRGTFVPGYTWMAQLEDYRVVSAEGRLRVENHEGLDYSAGEDGNVSIQRYSGTAESLKVPATLGGKPVTEIGSYAFAYRENLKTVTLPEGVVSIGDFAFSTCPVLESVSIPASVTEIGDYVFEKCHRLTLTVEPGSYAEQYCIEKHLHYGYPDGTIPDETSMREEDFEIRVLEDGTAEITAYTGSTLHLSIPDTLQGRRVTAIGAHAFEDAAIQIVVIPEGVTAIGDFAFAGSAVREVTFPESLRSLGSSVFNTTGLLSVVLPAGVTEIPDYTFYYCTQMESVTLPEGVTTIGEDAFGICSSLKSLTIPASVRFIDEEAFEYSDFVLTVTAGSYAEQFCKEHELSYVPAA